MDDANKELYPPVNNTVKNAMQQLCYFPNINFSLGDIQEIKISDIHKECIRLALKKLDKICEDCSGDHDYWTVAGGFATYHLGYTNVFSDIDIFISCNGKQNPRISDLDGSGWYRDRNVSTFYNKGIKTQIIQVNFNSPLKDRSVRAFYDLMAVYVISKFDIPLCKVSMKLNLDESDTDSAYVIDLTSVETNKPTTEVREQKYANRKVKGILKQVPRLSLLAAQALFLDK